MEEENELKPCWLMPLLKAKFYSLCESHDSKNTYFCLDCKGLILCEGCLKANKHPDHKILQVYKASHQVAIKVCELQKLMDLSCIQPYINNDAKVVYINQRRQKEQPTNSNYISNSIAKCERCGWQLLSGTTSKFCSIQCKINHDRENFIKQPNNVELKRPGIDNDIQAPRSYRKRRRKGIPQRSPLF